MSTRPKIAYRSTPFASAPTGVPRLRYQLHPASPQQRLAYAFDQELSVVAAGFPVAPLNTPANAAAFGIATFTPPNTAGAQSSDNAISTSVTQPASRGASLLEFTGSFAIVPASWDDFQSQGVTFPGIRDVAYQGGTREPKLINCTTRVRRDYFVIDPDGILTGLGILDSGGNAISIVTGKSKIPTLPRHKWQFLFSGSTLSTSEVTGLVKAGGTGTWLETVPNTANYQAWIVNAADYVTGASEWTDAAPLPWDGDTNDGTFGQYRFSDSRLEDYEGNIICRVSEYVLAQ